MKLRIAYLYPTLMNIYGDRGNIICLKKRCQWRGINVKVKEISLKNLLKPQDFDLLFGGGGQDRQQKIIAHDLQKKKNSLKEAAEMSKPMLLICGSYQLFGYYFKPFQSPPIPGINILDVYTIASKKRKIGNIIIKPINNQLSTISYQTVGFENHSGNTFLTTKAANSPTPGVKSSNTPGVFLGGNSLTRPLGKVIKGFGNNGQDKTEGAVYKNVIGTYLHGPILPKNPHLADWLIKTALEVKYQHKIKLKKLNDSQEWQAHHTAIQRTFQPHRLW